MPKYWGKQIFTHGRFPKVGHKQKTVRKEREREERKLVLTMAKLCMAHASHLDQNKLFSDIFFCFLQPGFGHRGLNQP